METKIEWQGKAITISSHHIGIDTPAWGGGYKKHHFRIEVECNEKKFKTDWWQSGEKMKVDNLRSCLETLYMDATYGDMTIDEFNEELCYDKVSECIKAYNGCKETLGHFKDLFIDPDALGEYLREKYDIESRLEQLDCSSIDEDPYAGL